MKENYRFLPYKELRIYVLTILFCSLFGPINYDYDPIYGFFTFLYIVFFLTITKIGMISSMKYRSREYVSLKSDKNLKIILVLSLILVFFIKLSLIISSIKVYGLPEMSNFFRMFAEIYTNLNHGEFKENIYRKIDTFSTFIFYLSSFVGLFWFNKISFKIKIILLTNIILDFIYQIFFIGTQRSIITFAILILVLMNINSVKSNLNIDKKRILKIMFLVLILSIIFVNVLSARKGLWNDSYYKYSKDYNLDSVWLFLFKNPRLKYDICILISYLTQGFYGLSLSLQTDFKWTFLLGGFRGINSIASEIIPVIPNMAEYSYPVRAGILFNRDGYTYWYSIFPWLASDFTFLGTLIYMGLVAKLYMRCWIQTVKYKNPLAFVMLVLLSIQYVFVVANNQLFVTRGESLATVIIFIIYLIYNKKFDYFEENK